MRNIRGIRDFKVTCVVLFLGCSDVKCLAKHQTLAWVMGIIKCFEICSS